MILFCNSEEKIAGCHADFSRWRLRDKIPTVTTKIKNGGILSVNKSFHPGFMIFNQYIYQKARDDCENEANSPHNRSNFNIRLRDNIFTECDQ